MKTTKRLLALNLVLVLLLTLMPMAALADAVSLKLGETVTCTKSEDSENAEFTFTPDKDGVYKIEITRPFPDMASPTFLMNYGAGETKRTLDVYSSSKFQNYTDDNGHWYLKWNMNIAYDLEAGVNYSFSFQENANGAYEAKITYVSKTEEIVEINAKNFPDEKFRNIVSNEYDFDGDGWLSTAEILNTKTVSVSYSKIESLEGIEYFTAMTNLWCYGNQLTKLPKLPESLKTLYCSNNQLTSLENLPKGLETLYCGDNKFTNLPDDLPGSLKFLSCRGTKFDSQPNFPDSLEELVCADCGLTELSELPKNLKSLNCGYNKLRSLPELPASLTMLYCSNNELTSIKLNNNKDYYRIDVSNNNLAGYDSVTGFDVAWDENSFTFGEQNHEHDMSGDTYVKPATCTDEGYTRTWCANCAYSEESDPTPALGGRHVLRRCENEAFDDCLICATCGDVFNFYVEEGNCEAPGEENELTYSYTRVWDTKGCYDTVVISGEGAMVDYDQVAAPWSGSMVRSFIVEEGVTSLGYGAARCFYGSSQSLAEVQLPSSLKTIGNKAFAYNIGLESITLPNGLETIGESAFEGCNLLKTVSVPASVTEIGKQSFSPDISTIIRNEVFAFSAYEVAKDNETYKSIDGILYSKDGKTLINCPAGKTDLNITVADGTTTLSDWAFYGNCNVQSITLPASIEKIDIAAFDYCNNLSTIYFKGTQDQWISLEANFEYLKVICLGQETAGDSLIALIEEDEKEDEKVVITAYDEGTITNDGNYAYFAKADLTADQLSNFVVIGQDKYQAYDIKVMTSNNEMAYLNGSPVQVKLTVPQGYDSAKCKVYHVVDGNLILMNTTVIEEDNRTYIVFATDSFSPFVVVQEHDHKFKSETVEPTCTTQGYTIKTCTVEGCDYTVKENFANAAGHEVVTDEAKAASCTENGLAEGKHCSVCNNVLVPQTVIPATGHNYVDNECTICGSVIEYTITVEGLPEMLTVGQVYDYGTVYAALRATSEAKSHEKVRFLIRISQPDGSSPEIWATDSAGTEYNLAETRAWGPDSGFPIDNKTDNRTDLKLKFDKAGEYEVTFYLVDLTNNNVIAEGSSSIIVHAHDEVIDEAVPATCTETGLTEGKHCSVCGEVIKAQEEIPANGHTEVTDPAKEPTCTETGLTAGKHCSVCNEVLVKQEVVSAKGHAFKDGKCSVCGAEDPTYKPPTPPTPSHTHKYTTEVTAPTCTEKGYTVFTCACGNSSYIGNYVDALGHDFVNGVCSRCKAVDPDYVAPVVNPFNDVKEGDEFYKEIIWAANAKLVNGYTDGSFKAGNTITRAEVVTMLWRQAGSPEAKNAASFADVAADAWYAKAVAWAVEKGITEGTSATTFEPEKACTRGEIVTFLWRANNKPAATAAASFTDLTEAWYKDAVAWAAEVGVTKGEGNGIFNPDGSCTRGQVAAFMFRLAQLSK